jgi:hypothetical protein
MWKNKPSTILGLIGANSPGDFYRVSKTGEVNPPVTSRSNEEQALKRFNYIREQASDAVS